MNECGRRDHDRQASQSRARDRRVGRIGRFALAIAATSGRRLAAYGANNAGSKYSPLDQINKETVKGLRIAWRQSAIPMPVGRVRPDAQVPRDYQHTPLMVGGLLYMSTALGTVAALNATTGDVVWVDPPPQQDAGSASRGVAYWTDGKDARIISVSGKSLVALNAKTGKRYPEFGY